MIGILLWNLVVFVAGAVSMVISAWWWMTSQDMDQIHSEKSPLTESILPDELVNKLKQEEGFHRRETCLSLNLILQFFFQVCLWWYLLQLYYDLPSTVTLFTGVKVQWILIIHYWIMCYTLKEDESVNIPNLCLKTLFFAV